MIYEEILIIVFGQSLTSNRSTVSVKLNLMLKLYFPKMFIEITYLLSKNLYSLSDTQNTHLLAWRKRIYKFWPFYGLIVCHSDS